MGLCNYRDNAGPPLHTGLSQEAPPSRGQPGLGTGAGQGELGSPQSWPGYSLKMSSLLFMSWEGACSVLLV